MHKIHLDELLMELNNPFAPSGVDFVKIEFQHLSPIHLKYFNLNSILL